MSDVALSLDDVKLEPQYSEVDSRAFVKLGTKVGKTHLDVPLISANMDTVTGPEMASTLATLGGMGVLHRKQRTAEKAALDLDRAFTLTPSFAAHRIAVSVGVREDGSDGYKKRLFLYRPIVKEFLHDSQPFTVVVDVAHGAQRQVVETAKWIRDFWGDRVNLVVGNFATPKSIEEFLKRMDGRPIDSFKIGIGPGAACTTRSVAGTGVPQFTAILECSKAFDNLIADGGTRNPGHVAVSLAGGADSVMIGYLFTGADEAPGNRVGGGKLYSGSSIGDFRDGKKSSEGVEIVVRETGPVEGTVNFISGGLRSAFAYQNSLNLEEFHARARWRRVSTLSLAETLPVESL